MTADPMAPTSLLHATYYEQARDLLAVVETSSDGDEVADVLDLIAQGGDLTHAFLLMVVGRLRGFDLGSGVEIATAAPHASALVLPPSVTP